MRPATARRFPRRDTPELNDRRRRSGRRPFARTLIPCGDSPTRRATLRPVVSRVSAPVNPTGAGYLVVGGACQRDAILFLSVGKSRALGGGKSLPLFGAFPPINQRRGRWPPRRSGAESRRGFARRGSALPRAGFRGSRDLLLLLRGAASSNATSSASAELSM